MLLLVGDAVMMSSSSGFPERTGRRMGSDAAFQGERGGVMGEGDLVKEDDFPGAGEVWMALSWD